VSGLAARSVRDDRPGKSTAGRQTDAAAILGALPVPVILVDRGNCFRHVNQAAEQFLGISAISLAQLRLSDLLPPDNPLFQLMDQVRSTGATIADHELTLESPRLHKPGVTVHASPLPEDPDVVVLVIEDASAARALDRQLAFRGAARSVTGMAAILAHEVKNPLSGIRGAAQILESSVAPADRELAQLIRDEADRIRALIDRMEAFDEKPIQRTALNIHRVLEHVRRLAQSGFAANTRFHELYDPSLPPVWGNRDQLVQALLNLVKNAAEAMEHAAAPQPEITQPKITQPKITLATCFQHGVHIAIPGSAGRLHLPLLVTVRDNGPGIPEDIRPHLFEPFVTSKAKGSGLGLALVAKIVGDHGGLIEVDSRPGRTEFRLFLPVASGREAEA
jgi:two-component system nitrogen regulation sensor histidine kinase GlnL